MSSIPPADQTPQPDLPVEQPPPDITLSSFIPEKKSGHPFSVFFSILFFIFGIVGMSYAVYTQMQITALKQKYTGNPISNITVSPPVPTSGQSVSSIQNTGSQSATTNNNLIKDTLCYRITLPQNHEVGKENNCDMIYRSFPDPENPDMSVNLSVFLHNNPYTNSEDMANKWYQTEKDHGSDETLIENNFIEIGGVQGYKIVTEYVNKSVQTTHIFIHYPDKYTSNAQPITGFELLSASDAETRPIQQKELERLFSSWKWK